MKKCNCGDESQVEKTERKWKKINMKAHKIQKEYLGEIYNGCTSSNTANKLILSWRGKVQKWNTQNKILFNQLI